MVRTRKDAKTVKKEANQQGLIEGRGILIKVSITDHFRTTTNSTLESTQ